MVERTIEWCLLFTSASLVLGACSGQVTDRSHDDPSEHDTIQSNLTTAEKRIRSEEIKRAAAAEGLTNAVLLAGVAESETHFAHCWNEATWACKGPHSSACNGPVVAGSGDGPCHLEEGGLGMFQFDAGTYDETLRRDGREVLTLEGNVREAVDFTAEMVRNSRYVSGVATVPEAIEWMNGVEVGGVRHRAWVETVTHYYNGCKPSYGCWDQRFQKYDNGLRTIYANLGGASFWNRSTSGGPSDTDSGSTDLTVPDEASPNWTEIRNDRSLVLTWNGVAAADTYDIEMQTRRGEDWRRYFEWDTDHTRFQVWPQADDSEYRWRLQACDDSRCSNWTDWRAFAVGHP